MCVAVALVLLPSATVHANPDIVGLYDARSMAMGGTGQASVDGPAAAFHNPANMERMGRFGFSLSLNPTFMALKSPIGTPYQSEQGTLQVIPAFMLSVAGRVHERITIGASAYVRAGFGGLFEDVTSYDPVAMTPLDRGDQEVAVSFIEMSLPVAIEVLENLHVGVALRWLHMGQSLSLVNPAPGQPPSASDPRVDVDLDGYSRAPGVNVGVAYEPIDGLRFGVTYRSRINVDLDGSLAVRSVDSSMTFAESSAKSQFSMPHVLQLGAAYTYRDITVAGDFAVRFWDQAVNDQTIDLPPSSMIPPPPPTQFQWKNSYEGRIGVEYRFLDGDLGVRVGYYVGNSATPAATANPFLPPPGILHMVSAGAGMQIHDFRVDLAGFYFILGEDVASTVNGPPGHYGGNVGGIGASLTYDLP